MSGQIDEISEVIGKFQSNFDHILKSLNGIDSKVDRLTETGILQQASIKSAHKRLDEITPVVREHEIIKNKGAGILTILGMVASFVGVFIGAVVSKLLHW